MTVGDCLSWHIHMPIHMYAQTDKLKQVTNIMLPLPSLHRCHTCDFIAQFCCAASLHDNVAACDCAVARSDFVVQTNQTNMTDYDILASSLV